MAVDGQGEGRVRSSQGLLSLGSLAQELLVYGVPKYVVTHATAAGIAHVGRWER